MTRYVRHCTVYRGRGQIEDLPTELEPVATPYCTPVEDHAIRTIMTRDLVCARSDLEIAAVVNLMVGQHIGCLPVVDERLHPMGVITKFDLVEQLDATMQLTSVGCPLPSELGAQTAEDVMMPIALTLDEHATIAHASSMMISEDTHHVLVVSGDGTLVGVVSAKDIVRWVTEHDVPSVRRGAAGGPSVWRPLEG